MKASTDTRTTLFMFVAVLVCAITNTCVHAESTVADSQFDKIGSAIRSAKFEAKAGRTYTIQVELNDDSTKWTPKVVEIQPSFKQ